MNYISFFASNMTENVEVLMPLGNGMKESLLAFIKQAKYLDGSFYDAKSEAVQGFYITMSVESGVLARYEAYSDSILKVACDASIKTDVASYEPEDDSYLLDVSISLDDIAGPQVFFEFSVCRLNGKVLYSSLAAISVEKIERLLNQD